MNVNFFGDAKLERIIVPHSPAGRAGYVQVHSKTQLLATCFESKKITHGPCSGGQGGDCRGHHSRGEKQTRLSRAGTRECLKGNWERKERMAPKKKVNDFRTREPGMGAGVGTEQSPEF